MKVKGKPGKRFFRYVLPHQYARTPKKIELFQFDKNGEAELKDGFLYDFEIKQITRKAENNENRKASAAEISVEEPKKEETGKAGRTGKAGKNSPSKENG